jgi:hypothetical protein
MQGFGRSWSARLVAVFTIVAGIAVVPVAGADAAVVRFGNTSVEVTARFVRVITPADPSNPPTEPPAILPTVTCVRRVDGKRETVFGYEHRGVWSHEIGVGDRNHFLDGRTVVADLGQVDQFLPGNRPTRFSVRTTNVATWSLRVPSLTEELSTRVPPAALWRVSVTPLHAPCRRDVPRHFAVMRDVGAHQVAPVDVVRDSNGRISSYALDFGFVAGETRCSAGGVPLASRIVFGVSQFSFNVVPPAPEDVIRTDTIGSISWVRTESARQLVADARSQAGVTMIYDVFGRCQFGSVTVEARDPRWDPPSETGPFTFFSRVEEIDGVEQVAVSRAGGGGVRFR